MVKHIILWTLNPELSEEEKKAMPAICDKVIDGIKNIATIGPDRAMNILNTRSETHKTGD